MTTGSPVSDVLRYIGYVNEKDLDGLTAMTSKNVKFTDYEGDVFYEHDFMHGYLAAYPEYKIHVHHALGGGEGVAIIGKTSGSHVGPEVEEHEILIWTAEVRDGLITEWRIYKGEA